MRILSASDAISPAIERTQLVLFKPFRWGRSWKLSATAYLSFAGTLFFPFPLLYLMLVPFFKQQLGHIFVISIVTAALLMTALYTWLFFLFSRLQFAFFDIVLNRGEFVAPAWRRYGAAARLWTWLKCALGIVATVLITAGMYPFVRNLITAAISLPQMMKNSVPGQAPPAQMFAFLGAFYGLYFVLLTVFGVYYLLLSTATAFMLPSMALEGVSPRVAFGRMIALLRQQPGAFVGFVGLRAVLGIAGYLALIFAYEIVLLVMMAVVGLVCWAVGLLLHAAGVPWGALFILGGLIAGFFAILVNGYLLFLLMGAYFTFFEAHTLYFLGGRYGLLGDLLERSTPPPPVPPAAYAWPQTHPDPGYLPPQG